MKDFDRKEPLEDGADFRARVGESVKGLQYQDLDRFDDNQRHPPHGLRGQLAVAAAFVSFSIIGPKRESPGLTKEQSA